MPPDGADNVQPEWGAKQRRKCCDQPTEQSPETQSDPNLTARRLNPSAPVGDLSETAGLFSRRQRRDRRLLRGKGAIDQRAGAGADQPTPIAYVEYQPIGAEQREADRKRP